MNLEHKKQILAQIAQSVEQGIENPRVGGSIPPLGTIIKCGAEQHHFYCPDSSVGRDETEAQLRSSLRWSQDDDRTSLHG